jgi:vacuolar-type H+-ATPase catalytic subunit A/Vma1
MTIAQIIQLLRHKEIIYAAIETYYQSLPDDDKEWVDSNWSSIQSAFVDKMAEMVENREYDEEEEDDE